MPFPTDTYPPKTNYYHIFLWTFPLSTLKDFFYNIKRDEILGVLPLSIPATDRPAGNHDVLKCYIMGVVKNKKRQMQSLFWQLPRTVKLFNLISPNTRKIASDFKKCMEKKRIEDIDSSQQRSQEQKYFGRLQKRIFWPVTFQLFSPMVLKSAPHLKNNENIENEIKEINYRGEIKKSGGENFQLQKRDILPNSLKLFSPNWQIDFENWLKKHAEAIKRNQEPTSYLSVYYEHIIWLLASDFQTKRKNCKMGNLWIKIQTQCKITHWIMCILEIVLVEFCQGWNYWTSIPI